MHLILQIGKIKKGEKVLITAAAGGVGHIAVQWAKAKGCHVIGTCSSDEKKKQLEAVGCDHVINYATEDLKGVLRNQYKVQIICMVMISSNSQFSNLFRMDLTSSGTRWVDL